MQVNVMQVFYGADFLPYKDVQRTVHYPIVGQAFMGAANTTEIRFYFGQIGDENATYVSCAKLPNGKKGYKVLDIEQDNDNGEFYAKLMLGDFYTQYKGDIYITLQGYQGGVVLDFDDDTELYEIHGTPTIQATGSIKLSINYAVDMDDSDLDEDITMQQLLALIGGKLNIDSDNYPTVVENIETADISDYGVGKVFFDKETRVFYEKTADGYEKMEYPDYVVKFDEQNSDTPLLNIDFKYNKDIKVVNDQESSMVVFHLIPGEPYEQGWIASCTLQIGNTVPNFALGTNSSGYAVYPILDGRQKDFSVWGNNMSPNGTLEVMAECNGFNIRIFAKETVN